MLPLQISDQSCELGSLGRKTPHTFTLSPVSQNIPDHIPRLCYYTPKILQQKGWMADSKWMNGQGLMCYSRWCNLHLIKMKEEKDMVRIAHPAPILSVFLVFAIALFSRLFFSSVRKQAVTVPFFNNTKQRWTFFWFAHYAGKLQPKMQPSVLIWSLAVAC